jgi:transposase
MCVTLAESPRVPRLLCPSGVEEGGALPIVHPICGGIDVHQAQLTACLRRVDADGQVTQEVRACATTDDALFTSSTWLTEQQCPVSALERIGVFWRPVYHVLVGTGEVLVGNAQEMRRRPEPYTNSRMFQKMI